VKKNGWIVVSVIVVAALSLYMFKQTVNKHSKAYELALEMKNSGVPVVNIHINHSDSIYEEVIATGLNLKVKISVYGNGLFMKNIVNSLKKDKKKSQPQEDTAAIYTAGQFIVVVYQEPQAGMVKAVLQKQFSSVAQY
jgi:hypothetical protein